ncbi:GNAT family N-acetyltransferase [Alteraurantiacibacter aestuarii]|uniref:GNAT family N-acetyltransferase n=1 Tax=Alteraurantiacibacter aestuarii TaxID=650004 RepID=A0A844ZJZ2_9SPHN|nr:GNAT family N-acetyltransferase [Alteraurantiacibacter aestuarii]MXO88115.1 GNAT family N-acetyltransferase [Alteraurantiacibacter aestuarii]
MTDQVTLRLARAEDAGLIQAMLEALAAETGYPGAIKGGETAILAHGFGPRPLFTAHLAMCDGKAVGMALCFPEYSSWRGLPGIYVQDLYVAPDHRGAGVALALLARAARGAQYLRLSVAASNEAGARFYEAAGFSEASAERIFVLEGEGLKALRDKV